MEERTIADKARIVLTKDLCHPDVAKLLFKMSEYDDCTFIHLVNVGYIAAEIMINEHIDKCIAKDVVTGALLHDIGKIKIPTSILDKKGELTVDEFNLIKNHPILGIEVIEKDAPEILTDIVRDIVLYHHERPNGNGYPMKIEKVPYYAGLIQAIDIYDAITSERAYSKAYTSSYAIKYLGNSGCSPKFIKKIKECSIK